MNRQNLSPEELDVVRKYHRENYKQNRTQILEQQKIRYERIHGYKLGRRMILHATEYEELTLS